MNVSFHMMTVIFIMDPMHIQVCKGLYDSLIDSEPSLKVTTFVLPESVKDEGLPLTQ